MRPVKPENELRNYQIHVRVTKAEFDKISAAADAARLSLSNYARGVCMGHRIKSKTDREAVLAVIKVNAHMGQIGGLLKKALSENKVSEVREALKELMATKDKIAAQVAQITKDLSKEKAE